MRCTLQERVACTLLAKAPACCHCPPSPAASRSSWQCFAQLTSSFRENPRRFREPAASVDERSIPARPGTGGTESTQTMGKVAAEMCSVTRASMPAELPRPTAAIHHFQTHAARTQRGAPQSATVERSDERLNIFTRILDLLCTVYRTVHCRSRSVDPEQLL